MAAFDAEAALKAGYSQAEVGALQGRIDAAKQAGYSDDEISKYLSSGQADNSKQATIPWGDVASGFVTNFPSSAYKNVVEPWVEHPVETAKGLGRLGLGGLQAIADPSSMLTGQNVASEDVKAIGKDYAQAYGGVENIKRTLRDDPFRAVSDVSMLTGGGGAVLKAAGLPATVTRPLAIASKVTNPFEYPGALAKGTRWAVPKVVGGLTHTGEDPLVVAAQAGYEGGAKGKAFREELRGQRPMEEVAHEARSAVDKMREEKNIGYRHGMSRLDQTKVLDFAEIDTAVQDAMNIDRFHGQDLSPTTQKIRKQMVDAIEAWKQLDPAQYHTLEGIDALKRKLGNMMRDTERGTTSRTMAERIYHGVRDTIVKADPEYARVMRGYEMALDEIKEVERALQAKDGAAIESTLRRLQSVMRNNVHTSYGSRRALAEHLATVGSPELIERLAGQALNTWMPRGLGKLGWQVAVELAALFGGGQHVGLGGVGQLTGLAALTAAGSPRAMGEVFHAAGRAAQPFKYVPEGTAEGALVGSSAARSLGTGALAP